MTHLMSHGIPGCVRAPCRTITNTLDFRNRENKTPVGGCRFGDNLLYGREIVVFVFFFFYSSAQVVVRVFHFNFSPSSSSSLLYLFIYLDCIFSSVVLFHSISISFRLVSLVTCAFIFEFFFLPCFGFVYSHAFQLAYSQLAREHKKHTLASLKSSAIHETVVIQ